MHTLNYDLALKLKSFNFPLIFGIALFDIYIVIHLCFII